MFLINFLKYILELFYSLIGSYGWSIILLSLTVTIIMLPLFWIAEKIQNKERTRKAKMQTALDKLKGVTNKQEKYYYTKRIYKQYNYSPLYSLTGLLGLLIQIPFFLAAYWMLLEYTPLEGVSFGPIKDLFQPDGLILFGGITINLLPFVMTIINLLAGYLYTKNTDKSEQIQLIVIAFVFLVLLYNMSAALVLYWTMNNVFAIGKNWVIKKIPDKLMNNNNLELKVLRLFKAIFALFKKNDYILYVVLLGVFPILSYYYSNIGELYFSSISLMLLLVILSNIFLSLIAKIIYKDNYKVIVFGFLAVILIFSFGHFVDFISEQFKNIQMRYFYLLYLVVGVFGSFFIFKTKINLETFSKTLKLLSIFLIVVMLSQIISYNINNRNNTEYVKTNTATEKVSENVTSIDQYPDIYYIVLDGYANSKILLDYYDFDNSNFENFLKNKGFYIASNSRANYIMTFTSVASTLNMNHLNYLKKELGVVTKDRRMVNLMIRYNEVINYLKNKGYKTVFFNNGWGGTDGRQYDYNYGNTSSLGEVSLGFLQTTIFFIVADKMFNTRDYANNVLYTFDKLAKIDELNDKSPKFVYAHIVCPHPPYIFDENGNIDDQRDLKLDNNWGGDTEKEYYLNQLKFMNKKTEVLINELLEKSKETVIVIQADHGPSIMGRNADPSIMGRNTDWNNPSIELIRERSFIFNAILLNNKDKKNLYPEVSSVNTFRVVFNNVFNDSLEILHDSTYFSSYETPYNFFNVTDSLLKE